jgi:arylsulfatase A
MTRSTGAAMLMMASALAAGPAVAESRPNIIYILADDLGYGDPGCQNPDSKIPTPNLDALAEGGVRFTDAHSPSAVCTPTRYGVLTGRYAWRTRLKTGVLVGCSPHLLEPARATVASLLDEHGYTTACIGKWHLGMDFTTHDGQTPDDAWGFDVTTVDYHIPPKHTPNDRGFDYSFIIPASLDMAPYIYVEDGHIVELPTNTVQGTRGLEFWRAGPCAPSFRHDQVLPVLTDRAVTFITRAVQQEEPFFLYLPLSGPHTPVLPTHWVGGRSDAGPYGDFVTLVDWTVGEIMRALDEHDIADETLIIFTSDNGSTMQPMTKFDHLPNGHWAGRKSDVWEGGHRVPFICRWPGVIPAGTISAETTCLTDLFATCAEVVGAPLPDDAAEDSFSMLQAMRGHSSAQPIREATVHHSISGMFAIRQGDWKLILGRGSGGWTSKGSPDDPPVQLYNLADDPGETTNLQAEHPEIVERLSALLDSYKANGRSR